MGKNIILTERQVTSVINALINEQSSGDPSVIKIQQALKNKGFGKYLGTTGINRDGVDGIMGSYTKNAITKFQHSNKLKVDGIVGVETMKILGINDVSTPVVTKTPAKSSVVGTKPLVDGQGFSTTTYLFFDGTNLKFIENGKTLKQWKGDSGRTRWNGGTPQQLAKNKDDFSKEKEQGPLPDGYYFISGHQKRTVGDSHKVIDGKTYDQLYSIWSDPKNKEHDWNTGTVADLLAWGNYRYPITKLKGTNTYNRGSFYVHGGGLPGSIGCIDLTTHIEDFVNYFTAWKSKTKIEKIKILVRYS